MIHNRRLIFLMLILALSLVTAGLVGAAPPYENPNNEFRPAYGLSDWHTRGYTTWIKDPDNPTGDGQALLPGLEATSAIWQNLHVPGDITPGQYKFRTAVDRKGLTANTAYVGMILYYHDGSRTRIYGAVPPWPGTDTNYSFSRTPYVSMEVMRVVIGAINFGKRGDGSVAVDRLVLCSPTTAC